MSAFAKKIIKAALDGVIEAQREYEAWSDEWLWMAPEYLTTVFVGKKIADAIGGKQLTLEHGTRSAMKDAGAKGRGKLHRKIRENGRFDLLVWNREGLPIVPVEIKVQVTNAKKILADVSRIEKVICRKQECSSFEFGMVVYYISLCDDKSGIRKARDKIEKRLKTILDNVKNNVSSIVNVSQEKSEVFVENKYKSAWAAVALIIEPATPCK
jgi:hypothetical protein